MNAYIERVLAETKAKNANEPEFLQTVEEVLSSIEPVIDAHPEYEKACLLERMVEPERTIEFRVVWMDDNLQYHVNRGYRVQYNAALGPYKGGLRFASNVNLSIIKFLGFEQTFKDALTCLPIGGAKGGSDFSPIGRSDGEVMRFCQAFMTEFHRHIGQDIDCPAGDVGVGGREVGYLYGQYRRIVGAAEFGAMSGKDIKTGGSILRPEATGFGAVYYLREVLKHDGKGIEGLRVAMSGYGNVGWGIMKKIDELGGKVTYFAGPDGYIHDPDGVCGEEKLNFILEMRAKDPMHCKPYADKFGVEFVEGQKCWGVKDVDVYMPAATQNDVNMEWAKKIAESGVPYYIEVGYGSYGQGAARYDSVMQRRPKSQASQKLAAQKPAASAPLLQLSSGDQIHHKTFGDGLVISVTPMGGDALLEVAFDTVGTKKLMLKTAGVHITKL